MSFARNSPLFKAAFADWGLEASLKADQGADTNLIWSLMKEEIESLAIRIDYQDIGPYLDIQSDLILKILELNVAEKHIDNPIVEWQVLKSLACDFK